MIWKGSRPELIITDTAKHLPEGLRKIMKN